MKIYIDSDYKCHVLPGEGLREFDVPKFNGCSTEYIEGYRYVPPGETWTNSIGKVFSGEMISPWKDSAKLEKAQLEYESALYKATIAGTQKAYESGVNSI